MFISLCWQIYIFFRVIGLCLFSEIDLGCKTGKKRPRCDLKQGFGDKYVTPRADFAQYLPEVYPGIVFYAGNLYEPVSLGYVALGERVGNAFADGKKLM